MYSLTAENAIIRANDYMKSGDATSALQIIYDFLESPRARTWNQSLEDAMELFLHICLAKRDSESAKDGINQYRNLCQNNNPASIDKVIKRFLNDSIDKINEAHKDIDARSETIVRSKDTFNPEYILLTTATTETSKQRVMTELTHPHIKFFFDCVKNILEALKNNKPLEFVYHDVCKIAFDICLQYKRTNDFKTLCRKFIRKHIDGIHQLNAHDQSQKQKYTITWTIETAEYHMRTKFIQFDTAVKLDSWSEVSNTIGDMKMIMSDFNDFRDIPQLKAMYYSKLITYLWHIKKYKYHAYCQLYQYMINRRSNTMMTEEQAKTMATHVLLSVLCIPFYNPAEDPSSGLYKNEREKEQNICKIIGFGAIPSRTQLVHEIENMKVFSLVDPKLVEIYNHIEDEYYTTDIFDVILPLFEKLQANEDYAQYIYPIKCACFLKLMKNLECIYSEYHLSEYNEILNTLNLNLWDAEEMIVTYSNYHQLHLHVDYIHQKIVFDNNVHSSDSLNFDLAQVNNQMNEILNQIYSTNYMKEEQAENLESLIQEASEVCDQLNIDMQERANFVKMRKAQYEDEENENEAKLLEDSRRELKELEAREKRRLQEEENRRALEEIERIKKEELEKFKKETIELLRTKFNRKVDLKDVQNMNDNEVRFFMEQEKMKSQEEVKRKNKELCQRNEFTIRAYREVAQEKVMERLDQSEKDIKEYWKAKFNEQKEKYMIAMKRREEIKPLLDSIAPVLDQYKDALYARRMTSMESEITARYEEQKRKEEEERKRKEEEERIAREKQESYNAMLKSVGTKKRRAARSATPTTEAPATPSTPVAEAPATPVTETPAAETPAPAAPAVPDYSSLKKPSKRRAKK